MSLEAIQSPALVDACSDLYAVGAVGYFLVTGKSVFDASSLVDLMQKHVTEIPMPPSQRANVVVSAEFENVLLACLEKSRARRPQTARELASRLLSCRSPNSWTINEAENWWSNHERRRAQMGEFGYTSISQTKLSGSSASTPPPANSSPTAGASSGSAQMDKEPTPKSSPNLTSPASFDQTLLQPRNPEDRRN